MATQVATGSSKLQHLNSTKKPLQSQVTTPKHSKSPTYKLDPNSAFSAQEIEHITEQVLIRRLRDEQYDPVHCKSLSQELAALIMEEIKSLRIKHFKVVALVSIGSVNERPGMQFGSRCLWNEATDSFASVKFSNGSLFAVAMVYGLYFV